MPDTKDPKDPSVTSAAYDKMVPRLAKMDSVLGGTETMREARNTYLPQHPEEDDEVYDDRVKTSTFLNHTEITLNGWVGKPFSEPVKLSDDMPTPIKDLMEDVDLQGNNIDVFASAWFKAGVAKGFSHVLVEFPKLIQFEDGRVRTMADDEREGLRPYWVAIAPENLFFARTAIVDGREILTHIRIREVVTEMVGFAETFKARIRVYDRMAVNISQDPDVIDAVIKVQVTIYEEIKSSTSGKVEWVIVDTFFIDSEFIPLVTFYSQRQATMLAKPPLLDLADINITHWQSSSDQRSILTVGRFPMLAGSGVTDEDGKLKVGPRQWLFTAQASGKFYYVEPQGNAINAGRVDIQDLQEQMAQYGAEFLKKAPGRETATARTLNSQEATSPLQDMVLRFMDALNQVIVFTGLWLVIEKPGTASVNTNFGLTDGEASHLNALSEARKLRDISRGTHVRELRRRDILGSDFDEEGDKKELEEENSSFSGQSQLDLDPGDGDNDDEGDKNDDT